MIQFKAGYRVDIHENGVTLSHEDGTSHLLSHEAFNRAMHAQYETISGIGAGVLSIFKGKIQSKIGVDEENQRIYFPGDLFRQLSEKAMEDGPVDASDLQTGDVVLTDGDPWIVFKNPSRTKVFFGKGKANKASFSKKIMFVRLSKEDLANGEYRLRPTIRQKFRTPIYLLDSIGGDEVLSLAETRPFLIRNAIDSLASDAFQLETAASISASIYLWEGHPVSPVKITGTLLPSSRWIDAKPGSGIFGMKDEYLFVIFKGVGDSLDVRRFDLDEVAGLFFDQRKEIEGELVFQSESMMEIASYMNDSGILPYKGMELEKVAV